MLDDPEVNRKYNLAAILAPQRIPLRSHFTLFGSGKFSGGSLLLASVAGWDPWRCPCPQGVCLMPRAPGGAASDGAQELENAHRWTDRYPLRGRDEALNGRTLCGNIDRAV